MASRTDVSLRPARAVGPLIVYKRPSLRHSGPTAPPACRPGLRSVRSFALDLDLAGFGAADRPLAAADLDAEGVAERGDGHDSHRRPRHEAHLQQAPAKRARTIDGLDRDSVPQRDL